MKNIKILVNALAGVMIISLLDEVLKFGLPSEIYALMGLTMIVIVIWLIILVNKKS